MSFAVYYLDNCTWIGFPRFSLQREDFLSAVNLLTNSPNISDITKRDIF